MCVERKVIPDLSLNLCIASDNNTSLSDEQILIKICELM